MKDFSNDYKRIAFPSLDSKPNGSCVRMASQTTAPPWLTFCALQQANLDVKQIQNGESAHTVGQI